MTVCFVAAFAAAGAEKLQKECNKIGYCGIGETVITKGYALKEKYGWEFLFLGANIDAVSTASSVGITADRAVTYEADSEKTRMNFDAVSQVVGCMRTCAPIAHNRKKDIEEHRKRKGRK